MPGPMHGMSTGFQKPKSAKKSSLRLIKFLRPQLKSIIFVIIFVMIATCLQIIGPWLLKDLLSSEKITGLYFTFIQNEAGTIVAKIVWSEIYKPFLIVGAVYVGSSLFTFLSEFIVSKVGSLLAYKLRTMAKIKIDKLPLKYLDKNTYGEVLSRLTDSVDTISNSLQQIITQVFKGFFMLTGVTLVMFLMRWELALIAFSTLPVSFLIAMIIAGNSQKLFIAHQSVLIEINGHIEETYSGHSVIKLFNKEQDTVEEYELLATRLAAAGRKSTFLSGTIQPILGFVHNVAYVFVCVVGGLLNSPNEIVAFFLFLNLFQQPIMQISQIANVIQQALAASEKVFDILDEEEEVDLPFDENMTELKGKIDFIDVDFAYDIENPLIEKMNLAVKPGDSIAIVGPTGAGKTTIVNLIMRFYEITAGTLLVDDKSINEYSRGQLRREIGMVLQDTWLFNGTIADNIAYGCENATREEVIAAARMAHAHHFINTLPQGYDTIINEEADNISSGEKQLLTIARAIITNPKIIILDEATSSVDTRTEKLIQDAMDAAMRGRTSFIIAHRLSTIKNAKKILVMKKGHIIEQGGHYELLEKKGFYYELYNAQFLGINSENSN